MPKRTSPKDAKHIEDAQELDGLVKDKRSGWRANAAKARRRDRRYKNLLTAEVLKNAQSDWVDN